MKKIIIASMLAFTSFASYADVSMSCSGAFISTDDGANFKPAFGINTEYSVVGNDMVIVINAQGHEIRSTGKVVQIKNGNYLGIGTNDAGGQVMMGIDVNGESMVLRAGNGSIISSNTKVNNCH